MGKAWYFHGVWMWGRNGWSLFVQPTLYSRNCAFPTGLYLRHLCRRLFSIKHIYNCSIKGVEVLFENVWASLQTTKTTNLEKILLDTADSRSQSQHQSILRKTCQERKQETYTKYSQDLAIVGGDENIFKTTNVLTWTFHFSSFSHGIFPIWTELLPHM